MVLVAESKTLEIEVKPELANELSIEIIKSLPIPPFYSELGFSRPGLQIPEMDDEDGLKRYLSECDQKGLVPFLGIEMELPPFSPSTASTDTIYSFHSSVYHSYGNEVRDAELRNLSLQKLISGNRIHLFKFKLYTENPDDFYTFRDGSFDSLVDNGYKLHRGDLWFDTYHDDGLSMSSGGAKLNLLRLTNDERQKLTTWFGGGLKAKYGAGQESLDLI